MVKPVVGIGLVLASFAYCDQNGYNCAPRSFDSTFVQDTMWVTGSYRIEHLRVVDHYAVFGIVRDQPTAPTGNDPFLMPLLAFDVSGDNGSQKYALLLAAIANDKYISFHLNLNHATDPTHLTQWDDVCEVDNVNIHGKPKGSL